ncbi:DUF3515 domain-containing protein [Nocardioides sp.]|uniref:DUF3515 domain-containing protein n=1 Tax=Nocardioides sp. TaxID=35761 RepID=UPI002733A5B0|nr:DUF3515 domain-containing protein [Nocardioides sp.]MDP3890527.1 DUF3515 domain-containing protein [Nocardioides sp.]
MRRRHRRPGSSRSRGVVASGARLTSLATTSAALVGVLTACTGPVDVTAPAPAGQAAERCSDLLAALPDEVAGQPRREVEPPDAPAAAWGDPAIVLTCGVEMPDGFDGFSSCQEVDGVGWYVPEEQFDPGSDVVLTTIGWSPAVRVEMPGDYRPPAELMVDLAPAITQTLTLDQPCL